MKSLPILLLGMTMVLKSFSAELSLTTNASLDRIFYDLTDRYTNAVSWYVIPPKPGSPDHLITVTHPPLDRVNQVGTHADFTVIATYKGPPITYQWYKLSGISNRVAIQGATENVFCIEGVQSSDVAGYEVVLSQAGQEKTNLLANLSVMTISCTASVEGVIESPITAFTTGPATIGCGTFNRLYSPWSNGKPVLLYGPWVPPIYQEGDAVNTTKMPKVTVSTHNPANDFANSPADTAIQVENFADVIGVTARMVTQCNDNVPGVWPGDPNAARLFMNPMSTSDSRYFASYKVTIYFNGNPPPTGKIYWNWRYHNDSNP